MDASGGGQSLSRDPAVLFAVVLVAFAAGAALAWESFGSAEGPAFFYPPAGVTAAAMLLSRRAMWPAVVAAVLLGEVTVDLIYGSPAGAAVGFAAANVVEPLTGATLTLAWCRGRPDLRKRRDFVAFLAGACLTGPLVGGLVGGTIVAVKDQATWLGSVATWWSGDALGVLVVGAPILLWATQSAVVLQRRWETAGLLVLTAAASFAAFWTEIPPAMLLLPVLAWVALRLEMIGAALAGALAALLADVVTTRGRGLFLSVDSLDTRVALTQVFIAIIVLFAMLIAQEASARTSAVREREAERRERLRLEALSRLALQLSAALTPQDIGAALEEQVLSEAGAEALTMALLSVDGQNLECIAMVGFPAPLVDLYGASIPMAERSVGTDVVRSGRPIEFHSLAGYAAAYPRMAPLIGPGGDRSIVGWPLSSGGEVFGALVLRWPAAQPLDPAQRAYASAVATMVSQALVRAKSYTDVYARAAVLHAVAQPDVRIDAVGLQYCSFYHPMDTVHRLGGDWYSVMALPDGRTYLTVGDIIGHGLPSVEDMVKLRSAGDAYAHQGLPPGRILTELNRFAADQICGEFATTVVGIFDPEHSSLSYSSAGHLPALLRRAGTGEVVWLSEASGPMLGPFHDSVYPQGVVAVEPGDVLVMYTDGLVEHHRGGVRAGIEHLERVLADWPGVGPLACESLVTAVSQNLLGDDVCLLVARFGTGSAS